MCMFARWTRPTSVPAARDTPRSGRLRLLAWTVSCSLRQLACLPTCPRAASRPLACSSALQVADFSSPRDLCFAANQDASLVALCDRGALHIWKAGSRSRFQLFPLPASHLLAQAPDGGSSGGGDPWHSGAVQAMQWSPDGRRLLLLVRRSGGGMREWAGVCGWRSCRQVWVCAACRGQHQAGCMQLITTSLRCMPARASPSAAAVAARSL